MGRVTDSGSIAQQISVRTQKLAQTEILTAQVTAVDGSGAVTLNIGGNPNGGMPVSEVPLQPGDTVRVIRQGGYYQVLGLVPQVTPPIIGTVGALPTDSTTVPVSTTIGTVQAVFQTDYTPTAGDVVNLLWLGSTPCILGKQGVLGAGGGIAPSPPPTPSPPPKPAAGVSTFAAVSAGTYRSGWLDASVSDGNVMQGDYGYGANSGAWFYGGRPHSSLSGATVTAAQIWLGRASGGTYAAQAAHLQRVTNNAQPSGALTFTGSAYDVALAVGQSGWFPLNLAIAQALVTSGGSIGVQGSSPYVRMYGLTQSGSAGAIKLTWKR